MDFNTLIAQWLFSIAHRATFLDVALVFLARVLPYFLVIGFFFFLAGIKKRRERILIFIQVALATILSRGIITEAISFFYHVARPFETWQTTPLVAASLGNSFPSGHATFYFALACTVLFYHRKWGWWYIGFASLIGIARIIAGVHWPSDIVGGAFIGGMSALILHLMLKETAHALRIGGVTTTEKPQSLENTEGTA
ncbi:MAG: phosphatase PAP2 family protein [Patescibacteria group bacterium]|nr:phosphatase PAP2 family protein [Patescibacteria group bacterium]